MCATRTGLHAPAFRNPMLFSTHARTCDSAHELLYIMTRPLATTCLPNNPYVYNGRMLGDREEW